MVLNICLVPRPELFPTVLLKIRVFWDETRRRWTSRSRRFEYYSAFIFRVMQSQKTACWTLGKGS